MKILHTTYILTGHQKNYILAVAVVGIFCFLSCKKNISSDEHPAFINAILKKIDTTQNKHIDATFYFIDSAFKSLPAPGIGDVFVKDSILQAKYRFVKYDYIKAISYQDSMLALIKGRTNEEKYAERYAAVLYIKGQTYRGIKRFNEALHFISLAEEATIKLVKNKCVMARYSGIKADLMFEQERYLSSANFYLQQYQHLLSTCDTDSYSTLRTLSGCLNNIGLSWLRAGMLDSAAWYQNAALCTIGKTEAAYHSDRIIQYSKAVVYGDQAEVMALSGKYMQAIDLYKKSIAGTSKADTGYTQATHLRLAELYLKENSNDSAKQVLEQLENSLASFENEKVLLKWYKLIAKYYSRVNQPATAFAYQQRYENLNDSVDARDKKFAATDIGKEFENLELRYSNEVLQKEGKLKTLYLIIAIFTFITVAAIAFFVWYNLKHTRKLHQQVALKNEDLQLALTSLEQSHQENNRIIRIVAHDLKSPISAINNLIFSLLRKDYPGDLKEIFQLIKTACSSSMGLINDVLNQKKDPSIIRTELVDMKRLLEFCVDLLQTKADEKKQNLLLHADNVMLLLNRQKMWRVISNIVNNAIKFSPENGVININLQKKENSVLLSVRDNGIGIPVGMRDKIFNMSPEASRPGTFGEESYGLGLSISRKIIEEHKGKIWFDSCQGEGSVFYVELPCDN